MRQLRLRYPAERRLIVFFGFIYPAKGVHRLFDIADSSRDHIIVAGAVPEDDSYLRQLKARADRPDWQGHVSFVGELAAEDVAALLAIADAAVFPFESGGGEWNSSLHAAILNRVFVVTSSQLRRGYDADQDIYFAEPGDDSAMTEALSARFAGQLLPAARHSPDDDWERIARRHLEIYTAHAGRSL
jgi:glycosyltransferase involved in cell wall biosynthesis